MPDNNIENANNQVYEVFRLHGIPIPGLRKKSHGAVNPHDIALANMLEAWKEKNKGNNRKPKASSSEGILVGNTDLQRSFLQEEGYITMERVNDQERKMVAG